MYIIRGFVKSHFNDSGRRYIQFNPVSGKPTIATKTGYRKHNNVMFATEQEAYGFLYKFEKSSKRRHNYEYNWTVAKMKSNPYYDDKYLGSHHFRTGKTNLRLYVETEYGHCYKWL